MNETEWPEARDPYVERRLRALEKRVAELEAEVTALRGEPEQPVDQVRSMHEDFVARLREAKR